MNYSTFLLTGLFSLSLSIGTLSGQYITKDVQSMLRASQQLKNGQLSLGVLDTLVYELAYYATAPDTAAARRMANGPAVLEHYGKNPEIISFLTDSKLDSLLWEHQPETTLNFAWLDNKKRAEYLRKPKPTELFTNNGLIDVEKIQSAYNTPLPPMRLAMPTAVDQAKAKATAIPDPSYISLALSGLSDWITRRAQEELTYSFLTRLREDLNKNKLDFLFPNTVNYLPTLNLINYKTILPSIRLAFAKDMNQISLNLGNFLNAKDPNLYADPAVYNLFMVYRLLDLGSREVPLSDILAFTYGELSDTRLNTRRNIDLQLADAAKTSEKYSAVMSAYNRLIDQLEITERSFRDAQDDLFDIQDEVVDNFGEDPLKPLRKRVDKATNFNFANLLFEKEEAPEVVQSWLLGEPAIAYYLANPSLAKYDELYGPNHKQLTEAERRAAGLTAIREVLQRSDELEKRFQDILAARTTLDSLKAQLNRPQPPNDVVAIKQELQNRLSAEIQFFRQSPDSSQLLLLDRLLQEVIPSVAGSKDKLIAISSRLDSFSVQRSSQDSPNYRRLNPALPPTPAYTNLRKNIDLANQQLDVMRNALTAFSQQNASTLIRGHRNAANFETIFGVSKELFFLLYNQPPEAKTDLALGFVTDQAEFAEMGTMTSFMLDPGAEMLIKGLARERLSRIPGLGGLNGEGIGQFVISFTEQLAALRAPLPAGVEDYRTATRIKTVAFITNTVTKIIEAPILTDPNKPGGSRSIADLLPGFAKVPEINRNIEELFRLSQSGQFRYSIGNLLNLLDLFNIVPEASKRQQKMIEQRQYYQQQLVDRSEKLLHSDYKGLGFSAPKTAGMDSTAFFQSEILRLNRKLQRLDTTRANRNRQKLFLYGTFIADVAAADDPDAFGAALNNVALPPGSSQLKRNRVFSLELNAYFGASYGREVLNYPDDAIGLGGLPDNESGVISLWVPVGMSMSWKTSYAQKSSYTLFVPLIDLGAVSAYRLDTGNDQIERLPRFAAQNVFAPGAHLMYNFANTPFSLGIGAQYGPTTRRIDPDGSPFFNASGVRYMATFSIDVPIFSFGGRQ